MTFLTFVSTTAICLSNAKHNTALDVYSPIPGNVCNTFSSCGNFPANSETIICAAFCKYNARLLYPSPDQSFNTSPVLAFAKSYTVGKAAIHASYLGITRDNCVCCAITSETKMLYGSRVFLQGRSR